MKDYKEWCKKGEKVEVVLKNIKIEWEGEKSLAKKIISNYAIISTAQEVANRTGQIQQVDFGDNKMTESHNVPSLVITNERILFFDSSGHLWRGAFWVYDKMAIKKIEAESKSDSEVNMRSRYEGKISSTLQPYFWSNVIDLSTEIKRGFLGSKTHLIFLCETYVESRFNDFVMASNKGKIFKKSFLPKGVKIKYKLIIPETEQANGLYDLIKSKISG
jgi:hypothetical protein